MAGDSSGMIRDQVVARQAFIGIVIAQPTIDEVDIAESPEIMICQMLFMNESKGRFDIA